MIQNLHKEYKLAEDMYSAENVLLSATHTHSGPAGYMQYALFQATSLGFINQTFDALVHGITKVDVRNHVKLGVSLKVLYCVVDTGYGLGRSQGDCRPALPKG